MQYILSKEEYDAIAEKAKEELQHKYFSLFDAYNLIAGQYLLQHRKLCIGAHASYRKFALDVFGNEVIDAKQLCSCKDCPIFAMESRVKKQICFASSRETAYGA